MQRTPSQNPTSLQFLQDTQSWQKNNPCKPNTELPSLGSQNSRQQAFSQPEAEAEESPLFVQQSQNDTRLSISTNSQRAASLPENPTNREIINAEQACFLRKICLIFVSMVVWIMLAREESSIKKLENLSLLVFFCVAHTVGENILFCLRHKAAIKDVKERLFDTMDGVLTLYFLLAVELWIHKNTSFYLLIVSPGLYLISTILSLRSISNIWNIKIIMRIC